MPVQRMSATPAHRLTMPASIGEQDPLPKGLHGSTPFAAEDSEAQERLQITVFFPMLRRRHPLITHQDIVFIRLNALTGWHLHASPLTFVTIR